jgi:hypothetical protein
VTRILKALMPVETLLPRSEAERLANHRPMLPVRQHVNRVDVLDLLCWQRGGEIAPSQGERDIPE